VPAIPAVDGVIEKEAGKRWTPILEHSQERANPEERGNLLLDDTREAHTGQNGIDDHTFVIEHERTLHAHFDLVAAPFEFPLVDRACRRQSEVDAAMLAKVVRG